jgi:hypothetical protein
MKNFRCRCPDCRKESTLTLLFSFWLSGFCLAVEYDTSYSPLLNGSAEDGLTGWSAVQATSIETAAPLLDRADLRTLLLIDRVLPDQQLTHDYYEKSARWFTSLEQIRGLFYMEYVQYAPHGGKIFWFDNKPMVTARFDFRDEQFYPAVRSTPSALARSINVLPKDPSNPDGYTFVTVLAWSKGLNDVYETIQLLDPDVRVVNAEAFIEHIHQNLKPSKSSITKD